MNKESVIKEMDKMVDEAGAKSISEQMYVETLYAFIRRIFSAWEIGQVDNSAMPAGAPITYYCGACGCCSDVLPECHLYPARSYCKACVGMGEDRRIDAVTLRNRFGLQLPGCHSEKGAPQFVEVEHETV